VGGDEPQEGGVVRDGKGGEFVQKKRVGRRGGGRCNVSLGEEEKGRFGAGTERFFGGEICKFNGTEKRKRGKKVAVVELIETGGARRRASLSMRRGEDCIRGEEGRGVVPWRIGRFKKIIRAD